MSTLVNSGKFAPRENNPLYGILISGPENVILCIIPTHTLTESYNTHTHARTHTQTH